MTANFIAQVVENYYQKLDIDEMAAPWKDIPQRNEYGNLTHDWINRELKNPTYIRWCQAIGVLETYCCHNFETFKETELVYKWAKRVCERRNHAVNEWKAYGGYNSFSNFLKRNNTF